MSVEGSSSKKVGKQAVYAVVDLEKKKRDRELARKGVKNEEYMELKGKSLELDVLYGSKEFVASKEVLVKSPDAESSAIAATENSEKKLLHAYEEMDDFGSNSNHYEVNQPVDQSDRSPNNAYIKRKVQYENLISAVPNEKRGRVVCAGQFFLVLFVVLLVVLVCAGFTVVSLELHKISTRLSLYLQEKNDTEMQLRRSFKLNAAKFLSYNGTSVMDLLIPLFSDLNSFTANIERLNRAHSSDYASLEQMFTLSLNQLTHFNQSVSDNFFGINQTLSSLKMEFAALNQSFSNLYLPPAISCAALLTHYPFSPSGYYWLRALNGSAVRAYCDMTRKCSGVTRGWTRVAYLQFENGSDSCPIGFRERRDYGIRTCGISSSTGACPSILFDTNGISYSRVCGKVRAYQFGSTDAFRRFDTTSRQDTIDSNYVDGVSLTHGSRPRKHIWTLVAAFDEFSGSLDNSTCPCSNAMPSRVPTPAFVGQDYFCDTGNFDFSDFHRNDPLWDGAGCGPISTCCSFNNPPWFHKQLPQPTTDDIEMRVCCDEDRASEDVPIASIEIYVQ